MVKSRLSYFDTEKENILFQEIIDTKHSPPFDESYAASNLKSLFVHKLSRHDEPSKPIDMEYINKQWFAYIAWHNYRYPNEQFTPQDKKIMAFTDWVSTGQYSLTYAIEIKHGERERYLFGKHIESMNNDFKIFKNEIRHKLNKHGRLKDGKNK